MKLFRSSKEQCGIIRSKECILSRHKIRRDKGKIFKNLGRRGRLKYTWRISKWRNGKGKGRNMSNWCY